MIQAEIEGMKAEIDALQEDLKTATPSQKPGIIKEIKRLQSEVAQGDRRLEDCHRNFVQPGTYQCDDGGLYYVREIGTEVFWFGEHTGGGFANVFRGAKSGPNISGRWFDVPKGLAASSGDISLFVSASDDSRMRVSATGGFGGSRWDPYKPYVLPGLRSPAAFRTAGFQSTGLGDLTGTWMGNDGGTYYIRQIGDEIVWFGESRLFSNVFFGRRSGDTVAGDWADVPKGAILQSGTLTFIVDNPAVLTRTAETGGFGGSRWSRVEALNVHVNLDTLAVHGTNDAIGADEPFLWTVFVKLDGDTIDFVNIAQATATVISTSGSHGNVPADGARKGDRLAIPGHVGRFSTVLKTIRGFDPSDPQTRASTRFGFLVVALEQDETSDGAIAAGLNALVSELQAALAEAIRSFMKPDPATLKERVKDAALNAVKARDNIFQLLFADDIVGQPAVRQFTFEELFLSGGLVPIDLDFDGDGHYQVTGTMQIT
jgi:hypothetical protein